MNVVNVALVVTPRDTAAMNAYKEAHPKCEICGWPRRCHCHHVLPLASGGTNDPSNLITLCANHHADAHGEMFFGYGSVVDDGTGIRYEFSRQDLIDCLVNLGPPELNIVIRRRAYIGRERRRRREKQRWMSMSKEQQDAEIVRAMDAYASHA